MGTGRQTWQSDNSLAQWSRDEHHLRLLYLPDKQMSGTKADKSMTWFTGHWVTGRASEGPLTLSNHSWPCWPLPYPTSDPTLRTISRAALCRRPHDLIKCNYHQPLVLGGGRRGDYLHIYFLQEKIIQKTHLDFQPDHKDISLSVSW